MKEPYMGMLIFLKESQLLKKGKKLEWMGVILLNKWEGGELGWGCTHPQLGAHLWSWDKNRKKVKGEEAI